MMVNVIPEVAYRGPEQDLNGNRPSNKDETKLPPPNLAVSVETPSVNNEPEKLPDNPTVITETAPATCEVNIGDARESIHPEVKGQTHFGLTANISRQEMPAKQENGEQLVNVFDVDIKKEVLEIFSKQENEFNEKFETYINRGEKYPYYLAPNNVDNIRRVWRSVASDFQSMGFPIQTWRTEKDAKPGSPDSSSDTENVPELGMLGRVIEKILIPSSIEDTFKNAKGFSDLIASEHGQQEMIRLIESNSGAGLALRATMEYLYQAGLSDKVQMVSTDLNPGAALLAALNLNLSRTETGEPKFPVKIVFGPDVPEALDDFKGVILRVASITDAMKSDIRAGVKNDGVLIDNGNIYFPGEMNHELNELIIASAGENCAVAELGLEKTTTVHMNAAKLLGKIANAKGLYEKYSQPGNDPFPSCVTKTAKDGSLIHEIDEVNTPDAAKIYEMLAATANKGGLSGFVKNYATSNFFQWIKTINHVSELTGDLKADIQTSINDIYELLKTDSKTHGVPCMVVKEPGTSDPLPGETKPHPEIFRNFIIELNKA